MRVELITAHKKFEVLLLPDCWNSVQKFIKALPSKETIFLGSGLIDVQLIRGFLSTKEMTHTKGVKTAGFHNGVFITEEGGLSSQGFRKDLIYFCKNQSERTNCKLISVEPATNEELAEIEKYIDSFNIPSVSLPILGWTVACFFKHILMEITQKYLSNGGFPSVNIQGAAGSGKTSTVQSILMCIWGIDMKPKSISELTRFTIMKRCNESNSIPFVLEENKSCLQKDYFNQMISALVRGTYNALEGERGKGDQTSIIYRYSAPIVIVGETGFSESALVDRLITVFLSRADSSPYLNNFLQLKQCPLDKLGRTILNKALKMDKQTIKEILFNQLEKVDSKLTDRPRVNAAICRLGLCILGGILQKDFELFEVDRAVLEGITDDGSHERKSSIDRILEAMCLMTEHNETDYKHQVFLQSGVDFEAKNGILKLYTSRAYPTFKRWTKLYEFEGDLLPQGTFKKQIKREPYFEEGSSIKIGGESKKGIKLNIDKMLSKGLEIYGLWAKNEKN